MFRTLTRSPHRPCQVNFELSEQLGRLRQGQGGQLHVTRRVRKGSSCATPAAMPFFKDLRDLRRRSKANIACETSSENVNSSYGPPASIHQSSSTPNSAYGSSTPPSSISQYRLSTANLQALLGKKPELPPRPEATVSQKTNRYSLSVCAIQPPGTGLANEVGGGESDTAC